MNSWAPVPPGGFGLVIPEQVAIAPDGRTSVHCAGIYDDDQIEAFELVPEDWGWWLQNFRGHVPSSGWPAVDGDDEGIAGLPSLGALDESA